MKKFSYFLLAVLSSWSFAAEAPFEADAANVRKLLGEMVAANTTNPPGNEARVVKLIAKRLKDEGIPYEITEFAPGRENLTARIKATNPTTKPVMLLAHIDVVGTQDQAWSTDPFKMVEKDGYLYGRGTSDDLGMAAINLEVFIQLKKSGVALRRDLILAMTGDEETGGAGIQYILSKHPEQMDPELVINEGGGPELGDDGSVKLVNLQAAEKMYQDYQLTTKGPTGHSSVPLADNSIYRLARALDRLGKTERPAKLIPVTRGYFEKRAALEKPVMAGAFSALARSKNVLPKAALREIEKDPGLKSLLRTTCVATMLKGGTKENALPPEASAVVNCRILPGETIEETQSWLAKVIHDSNVEVKPVGEMGASEASNPKGELPTAVEKIAGQMWPGAPVIPAMFGGATDSRYLRAKGIASYGIGPLAMLKADGRRAHGIDERIPVASIRPGIEFMHRLVSELVVAK